MTFARMWMLHFLVMIPVVVFLLVMHTRSRQKAMMKFADTDLIERLSGNARAGAGFARLVLLTLGFACLLIALAGPRWGSHYEEVSRRGVDIMIAVDTSASMLVQDVSPNRLERARREVYDLLRVLKGDRVGLIAFSGAAFVQCPLTLDYAAIEMFLSQLSEDLIPVPGTDLGSAIESAVGSFDPKSNTDKVILLITDGEDNEGRGLAAAQKAAQEDIRIYVFGIGDPEGEPIPAGDGKGGFREDEHGRIILSKLDEQGLREIAAVTSGEYTRAVTGDLDLDILYFAGIKSETVDTELKSRKVKVYEERFVLFVLAAFCLLLFETMMVDRKKAVSSASTGV